MNIKLKAIAAAVSAAAVIMTSGITVRADDAELEIEAIASSGSWGQSVKYLTSRNADQPDAFDPCTMTEDSAVAVTYESDLDDDANHIELIWQTWGDHTTSPAADWNKISPASSSKGYSEFTYADIAAAYGTDDFSEVYAICVGDTGDTPITVTSIVVTNVSAGGAAPAETEVETEEETEAETEAETEEETEAETEEETEAETEEETESETEEETEAETEKETEAETEEETEKETESETDAETEEVPAETETESDSGGIILVVIIIVIAAAIGVLIFLTKRKGPASDSDDWKR